jgi:drug/metabolite transporter (DMT)-like permease
MVLMEDPTALFSVSAKAITGMLYTAIVAMVICHWTWYSLLRMVPAAVAATSTLAIPISGVYASALFLDEIVGWQEVGALGLVVAGLFLVLVWPLVRGNSSG